MLLTQVACSRAQDGTRIGHAGSPPPLLARPSHALVRHPSSSPFQSLGLTSCRAPNPSIGLVHFGVGCHHPAQNRTRSGMKHRSSPTSRRHSSQLSDMSLCILFPLGPETSGSVRRDAWLCPIGINRPSSNDEARYSSRRYVVETRGSSLTNPSFLPKPNTWARVIFWGVFPLHHTACPPGERPRGVPRVARRFFLTRTGDTREKHLPCAGSRAGPPQRRSTLQRRTGPEHLDTYRPTRERRRLRIPRGAGGPPSV